MEIISRARWGARHRAGFTDAPLPAQELWLHHSVTIAPDLVWVDADGDGVEDDEERAMRTLEDIGEQRFQGGISYTFAVMPSGRIYEGHGVGRQGAHTGGRNDIARAIVLVGDYSTRAPTEAQKKAVAWLVLAGHAAGWWTVTRLSGGHRQAPKQIATACPGDAALGAIPEINRTAANGGPFTVEDDLNTAQDAALGSLWGNMIGVGPGEKPIFQQHLDFVVEELTRRTAPQFAAVQAQLAAIANDPDITLAEMDASVNRAVAEHSASAEDIAASLAPAVAARMVALLPRDETGALLVDIDEERLAELFVTVTGRKLSADIPPGQ